MEALMSHDGSHHTPSVAAEECDVGNGRVRPMRAPISAHGPDRLHEYHPAKGRDSGAELHRRIEPDRTANGEPGCSRAMARRGIPR